MALAESDVDRLVIGDDPADVQPAPNVPKKHAAPSKPTQAHKQATPPKPSPAPVVASVKIVSRPSGAVVKMNKRVFGRAPMNLRFRAGQSYELHFVKQGYVPTTKRVLVSQRKNQTLTVALRKKPPAKKKRNFIQRVFGL